MDPTTGRAFLASCECGIIVNRILIITSLACFAYGVGESKGARAFPVQGRRVGIPARYLLRGVTAVKRTSPHEK